MNIRITTSLFFLGAMIMACQTPQNLEEDRSSLLKADRDFARASIEVGAAEAFKLFLVDDALQLPDGKNPIRGAGEIFAQMKPGDDMIVLKWDPEEADVSASGDMGYTWGFYRLDINAPGAEGTVLHGKYLNVWKKQADGKWKVLVDMGNKQPE